MVNLLQNDPKPVTIDRSRLEGVQTPRPTLSWTPLPHHELMDRVERTDRGLRLPDTAFKLFALSWRRPFLWHHNPGKSGEAWATAE
jgi:hypothetical protein